MLYCITNLSNLSKVLKIMLVDNIGMCIQLYTVLSSLDSTTSRLGTSAPYVRSNVRDSHVVWTAIKMAL